ncbi:MAG: hypothetical protein HYZ08_00195 [Candidatus Kerfeldbacteria bacterium]|nr:hypothetical protein [Candidatus Kerfeldbacteria bacterium]
MQMIKTSISISQLRPLVQASFGNFVKAVVDVEKSIMVVGGELHADQEAQLLEQGSRQENLWGINIYPENSKDTLVEFDSMINIRPRQENRSRDVEDPLIREQILEVVYRLIRIE